ncbi:cyclic nucleotide-binding domain-containing protein [Desulfuromonas thiophila]|uniref:Cyclic nucleotide-binding domain-containing protein n=1 Tax=Desulfuromonas thiophila TaxID=57664 RepID=A0A1G6XIA8_9BACT|nr:cyclic nucleotide-binding domain-containing protein [Desulfuromonas thiophila]SDD77900.1 Cyclic nucleotide-binding domain-containing protein [Desulfuromonas thiophila]
MRPQWSALFRTKPEEESLALFLARVPVFSALKKRDLPYLERLIHLRRYQSEETVYEQGDPGSGMYIIRSGRVSLFTRDARNRKEELTVLGPGDFFGETTLAAPAARMVSAATLENAELIGLFRSDLLATADTHPDIANRILLGLTMVISERLQAATLELRRLNSLTAPATSEAPA